MPKLLNMLRRKNFSLMYRQGILQRENDCKHPTLEFQIAFMCHNHKLRNKRPRVGALEQASFAHICQYLSLWCCLEVGPHSSSSSSSELSAQSQYSSWLDWKLPPNCMKCCQMFCPELNHFSHSFQGFASFHHWAVIC